MKRVSVVAIFIVILCCSLCASAAPSKNLQSFMQDVLASSSSQNLPSALQTAQVFDAIPAMTAAELEDAVPSLTEALHRGNSDVQRIAIIAIYCIDQRPNSETLVEPLIPPLLALLDDPDPELVALAVRSVSSVKPRPPDGVVQPYLDYLSRVSPPNTASATIIFSLVRIAPERASIADAVLEVLRSQSMPDAIRVAVLNALAHPSDISDRVIIQIALDLNSSRSEEIRLAAIRALQVIGHRAIQIAVIPLTEISRGEGEALQIRKAATAALQTVPANNR
jgi:HEAT repeat protein